METLLDKALLNLKTAQMILTTMDNGDDRILNMVGYHLQQSAELFLKHYLETESTGYPFTHDITILTDLFDRADMSVNLSDEFRLITGSFTEWEAKTRYVKDYIASRRMILKALDILQKMYFNNGYNVDVIDVSNYESKIKSMSSFE